MVHVPLLTLVIVLTDSLVINAKFLFVLGNLPTILLYVLEEVLVFLQILASVIHQLLKGINANFQFAMVMLRPKQILFAMETELVHLQTNVIAIMDTLETLAIYLLVVENYQMIPLFAILVGGVLEKNNVFVTTDLLEKTVNLMFVMENHQMIQMCAALMEFAHHQTTAFVSVVTPIMIVLHSLVLIEILVQDMELALQQIIVHVTINTLDQIVQIQYASD
jgi:hypothetical protein